MIGLNLKVFLIIIQNLDMMKCSWIDLVWVHFKCFILILCFFLKLNLMHSLLLDLYPFGVLNQFLLFFQSSFSFFQILLVQLLYFHFFRALILLTCIVFLVLGWTLISFNKTFLIFRFHFNLFLFLLNWQILFLFNWFDFYFLNFSLYLGLLIRFRGSNYALHLLLLILPFFNL